MCIVLPRATEATVWLSQVQKPRLPSLQMFYLQRGTNQKKADDDDDAHIIIS